MGLRITKAWALLAQKGPAGLVRAFGARLADWREARADASLDRRFGLDTCGVNDDLASLGAGGEHREHGNGYEPIQLAVFRDILGALPVRPADYTFVDFGSGKGRAMILAAEAGFRRVIGVEFAAALNLAAERNFAAYRRSRPGAPPLEVHGQDATTFVLPPDDAVLFFYNPFDDVVMSKIIARIEEDWRARPRDLVLAYRNPQHAAVLDGSKILETVAAKATFRIYRTKRATGAA